MATDPVDLLLDFLNTVDVEGRTDLLDDPQAWAAWSRERGFDAGNLADARSARDALRGAVTHPRSSAMTPSTSGAVTRSTSGADDWGPAAPGASVGAPVELPPLGLTVAWADGGPSLTGAPGPDGPDAAGAALAAAVVLHARGVLHRIKICPADDCRWAFYDRSRNSSRTWCSMAVCGNRAKTRAFRERRAD